MLDKKLPIREFKPMPASMNKNHLTSGLLMQAQGRRFFPSDGNELSHDLGNESHQLALTKGVLSITWSWADVQANKEDFQLLMASYNKDAENAMADSELHAIADVIVKMGDIYMVAGQTLEGALIVHLITHASSSWDHHDIQLCIDFAKEAAGGVFNFVFLLAN